MVYKLLCSLLEGGKLMSRFISCYGLLEGGKLMSRFISCYVVCWRVES